MSIPSADEHLVQNVISPAIYVASPNGMQRRSDAEELAVAIRVRTLFRWRLGARFFAHAIFAWRRHAIFALFLTKWTSKRP